MAVGVVPRLGAVVLAATPGVVRGELGHQVVDAGVADGGGEAVGVADHPAGEEAAVGATRDGHALSST